MDDYYDFEDAEDEHEGYRDGDHADYAQSINPAVDRIVDVELGLKELKRRRSDVQKEERDRQLSRASFANLALSPKRGKIRPKSAPLGMSGKDLKIKDNFEDRPQFSKAELDRIVKRSAKSAKAKSSGNRKLKQTAEFVVKMQEWGKKKPHGEMNAKQVGSKSKQERKAREELEHDLKMMMSTKGADTSKSYQRIKSYNKKADKVKSDMELQVYNETMKNLISLFDSLNQANTICMGNFTNIRYEIHHKQTDDDVKFWNLAKNLVKKYKKENSCLGEHMDMTMRCDEQIEKHRKIGQELLLHGCGTRMQNIFIEELEYDERMVLPSVAGISSEARENVTVRRLISLEKLQNTVLPELQRSAQTRPMGAGRPQSASTTGIGIVSATGRNNSDTVPAGPSNSSNLRDNSVLNAPPPVGMSMKNDFTDEDFNYYSNYVTQFEGGGWNAITQKMKQLNAGGSHSMKEYISSDVGTSNAPPRQSESILMSIIQGTLMARKLVERQLEEIRKERLWNECYQHG